MAPDGTDEGPVVAALLHALPRLVPECLKMVGDVERFEPDAHNVGAYAVISLLYPFEALQAFVEHPDSASCRMAAEDALIALEAMAKSVSDLRTEREVTIGVLEAFVDDESTLRVLAPLMGPTTMALVRSGIR